MVGSLGSVSAAADEVKDRIDAEVDRLAEVLVDVSHRIHERPELAFGETHAHDVLTDVLEAEGLTVERSAYGLDTAFAARAGTEGPTVVVCCEYDALPGIGHACGHNVIAAAGLGAGLAAASVAADAGGRVLVLGTPGEEGGGGKQLMIDAGALEGVDAAVMVHPAGADLRTMDTLAIQRVTVTYAGHAAHAAAAPGAGPQRPRRRRARLRERGRPAPAHQPGRAGPRHLPGGRRRGQHRPGPDPGPVVRALAHGRGPGRRSASG